MYLNTRTDRQTDRCTDVYTETKCATMHLNNDRHSDRQTSTHTDTREADTIPTDAIPTIQSGRPSTSLAHLSICRNSRNLENWRGSMRRMHQKHGIDRGTEVTEGSAGPREGIPVGSWVPLSRKVCFFSAHFGAFGFIQEFICKSYNVLPTQLFCP